MTAGAQQLQPLVYPLVQVTLGTVTHLNAPKYYPLRLQLSRALIRVARSVNLFFSFIFLLVCVAGTEVVLL